MGSSQRPTVEPLAFLRTARRQEGLLYRERGTEECRGVFVRKRAGMRGWKGGGQLRSTDCTQER